MATGTPRARRRGEPLTRERIVEAAIGLLDAAGESGLTFRALAERLVTGPGAIYWHVTDKDELLAAATDAVVANTMTADTAGATPQEAVRALALDVFDAIAAHPWIGSQLARDPWRSPVLRVFEHIGRQVQALGVPDDELFTAASALLNYILGVGGQNTVQVRGQRPDTDRTDVVTTVAEAWTTLDPEEYAFTRTRRGSTARPRRPGRVPRGHRPHPHRDHRPAGGPAVVRSNGRSSSRLFAVAHRWSPSRNPARSSSPAPPCALDEEMR